MIVKYQRRNISPLVYLDGGNKYKGRPMVSDPFSILRWIEYGRRFHQKYMYSGYRHWANKTEDVIVFGKVQWNDDEKQRREDGGLYSIFEYDMSEYREFYKRMEKR